MKTRNGFVSNSSSASFVILGYSIKKIFPNGFDKVAIIKKYEPELLTTETFKKYGVDEIWYDFLYGTDFGVDGISYLGDDGPGYIGVILADVKSDDSYLKKAEWTIESLMKPIEKLQKAFGITDLPMVITGTRSC